MRNKNSENPGESQTKLSLLPTNNKSIELTFSGERISSDGGLLLLREIDNQIDLLSTASQCIKDKRDQRYIDHSISELISQRVYQIAAGYEDGNDCSELREDIIMKLCSGRLPQTGADLASQPTMSRLENAVSHTDLYRLGQHLVNMFIDSYTVPPKIIVIDCDDTNNDTYGQQELSLFNNYYHDYCYMPLHIYEGLSGKLITTILRPGRRNKQANIARLLKKLVKHLCERWPSTLIAMRGDSHFASDDFMAWCESTSDAYFITGLTGNKRLKKLSAITVESAEREFGQTGKPVKRYHSFLYKADSWNNYRRVVVKVEVSSKGTNIRYIVSNMDMIRSRELYEKGYCARGAMELRIKDHKLYLKSDRSSCTKFTANQFRLFLHSMAYILIHNLQKEILCNTQYANATMKTIQIKIIKTAAWVKEMKTKIKIEFPTSCRTKTEQINAFNMFSVLRC